MRVLNVTSIVECIEGNFRNSKWNVGSMQEMLHQSPSSVRDAVHVAFGTSPQKLLESRRLLCALEFLSKATPMDEICQNCGYSSMMTFNSAFMRRFNKKPMQWRLEYHKANDKQAFVHSSREILLSIFHTNPFEKFERPNQTIS